MKKKEKLFCSMGTVIVFLFITSIFILPSLADAKAKPIEGVSYFVKASIKDNLESFMGKKISVTLKSGSTFTGTIKAIGDNLIHLEKLGSGKDFYDALIRIDEIIAIDAQFRAYQ